MPEPWFRVGYSSKIRRKFLGEDVSVLPSPPLQKAGHQTFIDHDTVQEQSATSAPFEYRARPRRAWRRSRWRLARSLALHGGGWRLLEPRAT